MCVDKCICFFFGSRAAKSRHGAATRTSSLAVAAAFAPIKGVLGIDLRVCVCLWICGYVYMSFVLARGEIEEQCSDKDKRSRLRSSSRSNHRCVCLCLCVYVSALCVYVSICVYMCVTQIRATHRCVCIFVSHTSIFVYMCVTHISGHASRSNIYIYRCDASICMRDAPIKGVSLEYVCVTL